MADYKKMYYCLHRAVTQVVDDIESLPKTYQVAGISENL